MKKMKRPDIEFIKESLENGDMDIDDMADLCDYIKELEERIKQIKQVALGDFEKGEHHE